MELANRLQHDNNLLLLTLHSVHSELMAISRDITLVLSTVKKIMWLNKQSQQASRLLKLNEGKVLFTAVSSLFAAIKAR